MNESWYGLPHLRGFARRPEPAWWYHLEIWAAVWYKRGKRVLASGGVVAQVSHGSFKPGSGVKPTLMMLCLGLSLD
jgi:hypothetical protein